MLLVSLLWAVSVNAADANYLQLIEQRQVASLLRNGLTPPGESGAYAIKWPANVQIEFQAVGDVSMPYLQTLMDQQNAILELAEIQEVVRSRLGSTIDSIAEIDLERAAIFVVTIQESIETYPLIEQYLNRMLRATSPPEHILIFSKMSETGAYEDCSVILNVRDHIIQQALVILRHDGGLGDSTKCLAAAKLRTLGLVGTMPAEWFRPFDNEMDTLPSVLSVPQTIVTPSCFDALLLRLLYDAEMVPGFNGAQLIQTAERLMRFSIMEPNSIVARAAFVPGSECW